METRKQKAFLKISLLFLLFAALVAVVTAVSYRSLLKAFYPMRRRWSSAMPMKTGWMKRLSTP